MRRVYDRGVQRLSPPAASALDLIGRTPMLELGTVVAGSPGEAMGGIAARSVAPP